VGPHNVTERSGTRLAGSKRTTVVGWSAIGTARVLAPVNRTASVGTPRANGSNGHCAAGSADSRLNRPARRRR
jgi:hypothetical protein